MLYLFLSDCYQGVWYLSSEAGCKSKRGNLTSVLVSLTCGCRFFSLRSWSLKSVHYCKIKAETSDLYNFYGQSFLGIFFRNLNVVWNYSSVYTSEGYKRLFLYVCSEGQFPSFFLSRVNICHYFTIYVWLNSFFYFFFSNEKTVVAKNVFIFV